MAVIGYARISSSGQKLEIQLGKLTSHGCDRIYQEKQSGLNAHRPQLMACLDYIREGDTLMVTKLDRLARSTLDLCTIAERLKTKKIIFKVLDQNIDTSGSSGRLLFHMLSTIAQFETEIRKERQTEEIKKAKEKGVLFGRLNLLTEKQAEELVQKRQQGVLIESAPRYVIQKRLKLAGAWWKETNAADMLELRVNRANRNWDGYWVSRKAA